MAAPSTAAHPSPHSDPIPDRSLDPSSPQAPPGAGTSYHMSDFHSSHLPPMTFQHTNTDHAPSTVSAGGDVKPTYAVPLAEAPYDARTSPEGSPRARERGLQGREGADLELGERNLNARREGPGHSPRFGFGKMPQGPVARSYMFDWAATIILWIAFYLLDKVDGYRRHFSLRDITIQYPFAEHERVPVWALGVIAILFPILVILGYGVFDHVVRAPRWRWNSALKSAAWDIHCGLLGLLLSLALATSVTQVIKITAGRPRPDMLDRCRPREGSQDASVFGLSDSSICTQEDQHKLWDGFRSFPSGHSSTAFAGLGYLFLYLSGKLHLFDRRGHQIKAWIVLIPLLAATLIAVSRTMDNRHHYQDVTIGSILGYLTAWFAYRLYYPPLAASDSDRPHDVRGRDPYAPQKLRSDSQESLP